MLVFSQLFFEVKPGLWIPLSLPACLTFVCLWRGWWKSIRRVSAYFRNYYLFLAIAGIFAALWQLREGGGFLAPAFYLTQYLVCAVGFVAGFAILDRPARLPPFLLFANTGLLIPLVLIFFLGQPQMIPGTEGRPAPVFLLPGPFQSYQFFQYTGVVAGGLVFANPLLSRLFPSGTFALYVLLTGATWFLLRSAGSLFFSLALFLGFALLVFRKNIRTGLALASAAGAAAFFLSDEVFHNVMLRLQIWRTVWPQILSGGGLIFGSADAFGPGRIWAHNQWLDYLWRFGLPLGGAVMWHYGVLVRRLFLVVTTSPRPWGSEPLPCLAAASLAIFFLAAAITVPLSVPNPAVTAYFFLGLVARLALGKKAWEA